MYDEKSRLAGKKLLVTYIIKGLYPEYINKSKTSIVRPQLNFSKMSKRSEHTGSDKNRFTVVCMENNIINK